MFILKCQITLNIKTYSKSRIEFSQSISKLT